MLKRTLIWMTSVVGVVLFAVSGASAAEAVAAPTLIMPADGAYTESQSPWITGLAPADTRVAVYIDDVFNGYADVVATTDETLSFAYQPFHPLEHGEHTVKVRAEDVEAGTRSTVTQAHTLVVEHELPAPTVLGRVIDQDSSWTQPWIVGVAPAGVTVEVWIDGVFNGYATVSESESGTGHFAYKPFLPLTAGKHEVTVRSKTERADDSMRYSAVSEVSNLWIVDPETVEESTETTEAEEATAEGSSEESGEESQATEESAPEAAEETAEETNEETHSEDGSEEGSEGAMTSEDSDSDSDESEEGEESSDDEKEDDEAGEGSENGSNTRTVVGWLLLVVAAIIVARQIGMRRKGTKSSTDSASSKTQLDISTEEKNSNIEVISPATDAEAKSSDDSSGDSSNS